MDGVNNSLLGCSRQGDDEPDKVDGVHLGRKASITSSDDSHIADSQSGKTKPELSEKSLDHFMIDNSNSSISTNSENTLESPKTLLSDNSDTALAILNQEKKDSFTISENNISLNSNDTGIFSLTDNLNFIKELGRGGYGSVCLVDSDEGVDKYAFKFLFNSKLLATELEKMEKVGQHPNIVESFGVAEIDGKEGLLMEYIPGKDLSKFLPEMTDYYLQGKLSHSGFWGTIQFILKEILSGISHLGKQGCAHQDIKPQNIRIHEKKLVPVIIDFGNLAEFGEVGKIGTELYSTPESFTSNEKAKVSDKFDTYSIGQITYSILAKVINPCVETFFTAGAMYKDLTVYDRMAIFYRLYVAMTEYQKTEHSGDYKKALNPISQDRLDCITQGNLTSALEKAYEKNEIEDVPLDVMIEREYPKVLREAMTGFYREGYESSLVKFINSALHPIPSLRINAAEALKTEFISDPIIDDESAKKVISDFFEARFTSK